MAAKAFVSLQEPMAIIGQRYMSEFEGMEKDEIIKYLGEGERIQSLRCEITNEHNGMVRVDNLFQLDTPQGKASVYVDVETEGYNRNLDWLLRRAITYSSAIVFNQKRTDYKDMKYEKVKNVYCIWIIKDPPEEYRNHDYMYEFTGLAMSGGPEPPGCPVVKMVLMCLGDPDEADADRSFPIWLMDTAMNGDMTKEERLRRMEAAGVHVSELMEQDLDVLTESQQDTVMEIIRRSEEARAEGEARGEAKGMAKAYAHFVRKSMLEEGIEEEKAMDRLDVPEELRDMVRRLIAEQQEN